MYSFIYGGGEQRFPQSRLLQVVQTSPGRSGLGALLGVPVPSVLTVLGRTAGPRREGKGGQGLRGLVI